MHEKEVRLMQPDTGRCLNITIAHTVLVKKTIYIDVLITMAFVFIFKILNLFFNITQLLLDSIFYLRERVVTKYLPQHPPGLELRP